MYTITIIDDETIQCGPFIWERQLDLSIGIRSEAWVLSHEEQGLPYFTLSKYHGEPHRANDYSGWRLCDYGPKRDAGGWSSRDEAMIGCIPWLKAHLTKQANDMRRKADALLAACIE